MARLRPKRRGPGLRIAFTTLVLLVVGLAAARVQLGLVPPHVVFGPSAALTEDKKRQLADALAEAIPSDRDQAIDFALDFTRGSLSFSLAHPTSTDFGPGTRHANSEEYAAFFIAVFEVAAKAAGTSARAYRVRSDVRVFNKRLPLASLATHDWVLIADPADGARMYLDPTLSDLWLGASVGRNVKDGAAIALPK